MGVPLGPLPSSPYLGSEHVRQAVGGSVEREAPDQVDDEHTVGQQRREVYHLWAPEHRVSSLEERALRGPQAQGRQTRHPHGTPQHHLGCLGDRQLGRHCGSWSDTGSEFGKLGGGHGCPRV